MTIKNIVAQIGYNFSLLLAGQSIVYAVFRENYLYVILTFISGAIFLFFNPFGDD